MLLQSAPPDFPPFDPTPTPPPDAHAAPSLDWSVVLPYFNEQNFILDCLRSLVAQTLRPLRLILVNNASTDGSEALARGFLALHPDVDAQFVYETRPGKLWALKSGAGRVTSPFVATCDADTHYPPDYLAKADRHFASAGASAVAVFAVGLAVAPDSLAGHWRRIKPVIVSRLFRSSCHTGGFGQCFRASALNAAGGFDPAIWPFVLEDHEVVNRLRRHGSVEYAPDFWCAPSDRRSDRSRVDWTLAERLAYNFVPAAAKDWFFYRFLARRFRARGLSQIRLREKQWEQPEIDYARTVG